MSTAPPARPVPDSTPDAVPLRAAPGNDNEPGGLKKRFFIAVMPPPGMTAPLTRLPGVGPVGWDWKSPDDYHISLAFPGMLDSAQLSRLFNALSTVRHPPFTMRFDGLSCFLKDPHARNRRAQNVLWARPDGTGDEELRKLHGKIAAALRMAHLPYGIRDITPHLTVAKVPANDNSLIRAFAAAHDGHGVTAPWHVDRIGVYETLARSDPRHPGNNGGRGTRYVPVAEFMLGP